MNQLIKIFGDKTEEAKTSVAADIALKMKRMEKLKKERANLEEHLRNIRSLVKSRTAPIRNEIVGAKENRLLILLKSVDSKGFTKWQREVMHAMINEEYNILRNISHTISPEVEEKYDQLQKKQFENLSDEEKETITRHMKKMFRDFSGKDEVIDFEFENFWDYDKFEQRMREEQFRQDAHAKDREQKLKVSNTDLDFQKIYKKLAKKVHPDIFRDEEERARKEEQMKTLTTAWESRDYYALLMFALEVDPEIFEEVQLAEANQKKLIDQMNDKISEMNYEISALKNNSEYSYYYRIIGLAKTEKTVEKKISAHELELRHIAETAKWELEQVSSMNKLKKILAKKYDQMMVEDELFGDFGGKIF